MFSRLEFLFTDIQDIIDIVRVIYNYEYEFDYTEIDKESNGIVGHFDCSSKALHNLTQYEIEEIQNLSKELHEKTSGTPLLSDLLRVLVYDGVLEKSHYLISETWG